MAYQETKFKSTALIGASVSYTRNINLHSCHVSIISSVELKYVKKGVA
jgi:hypothetical protein